MEWTSDCAHSDGDRPDPCSDTNNADNSKIPDNPKNPSNNNNPNDLVSARMIIDIGQIQPTRNNGLSVLLDPPTETQGYKG
jgi:hypothetical protein